MNQKLVILSLMFAITGAGVAYARPLTPLDVVNLDQASDSRVSPDGKTVIYDVRTTDYPANKYVDAIWLMALGDKTPPRRLAASDGGASSPRWSIDGNSIYFLSDRSGSEQIWKTDRIGSSALQVTRLPLSVGVFKLTPDGTRIVASMAVFPDCETPECTVERQKKAPGDKTTGQVFTRLNVRQDYQWEDGARNHLFALNLDASGLAVGAPVALMPHFDGDCPRRVRGSDQAFDVSPDGRTVYFTAKIAGQTEAWSDNKDIWRVPIDGTAAPVNLTADNLAADIDPTVSPDGHYLAYRAQNAADGTVVGQDRIEIIDLKTGAKRELASTWAYSPLNVGWSRDGRSLLAEAQSEGAYRLFRIDLKSGKPTLLTTGGGYSPYNETARGGLVFTRSTFTSTSEVYLLKKDGQQVQLTHLNDEKLAGVQLVNPDAFSFSGWNGETVHGFIFKPFNYEPGHRYPAALLIHGGPEDAWTDTWSSRWNPQTFAAAGLSIVMINIHGSTGYGKSFTDSVVGHFGDRPLEDLQKGWAYALANFSFLDGSRACAVGPSYGGYMVDWIAGSWNQPWRCLISHDGIFDNRIFAYTSDIVGFSEWVLGGGAPVFEHPEKYEQFNPLNHVANWSKPMLIIHSGNDFRVPIDQSFGAFTALQRRGIPSKLLYFPDETHVIVKPQNIVQWTRTMEEWIKQWTGT